MTTTALKVFLACRWCSTPAAHNDLNGVCRPCLGRFDEVVAFLREVAQEAESCTHLCKPWEPHGPETCVFMACRAKRLLRSIHGTSER